MVSITKRFKNNDGKLNPNAFAAIGGITLLLLVSLLREPNPSEEYGLLRSTPSGSKIQQVSETCKAMPVIRPSGVFLIDPKFKEARSREEYNVRPLFSVASVMADKAPYHMKGDSESFDLVKSLGLEGKTVLDIGANQGFFTYYLAALGVAQVHAFEMNPDNFRALEHGVLYNSKAEADRVSLYNAGISDGEKRVGFKGTT